MPARRTEKPEPAPDAAPSFEAAMEQLEGIVDQLESGELPLEEALASFEQGVALSRQCAAQLESAERRIEVLVQTGSGLTTEPFDAQDEDGGGDGA